MRRTGRRGRRLLRRNETLLWGGEFVITRGAPDEDAVERKPVLAFPECNSTSSSSPTHGHQQQCQLRTTSICPATVTLMEAHYHP